MTIKATRVTISVYLPPDETASKNKKDLFCRLYQKIPSIHADISILGLVVQLSRNNFQFCFYNLLW